MKHRFENGDYMPHMIDVREAIEQILQDKVNITQSLLAVGGKREVYEAINNTCDRHIRMLKELCEQEYK